VRPLRLEVVIDVAILNLISQSGYWAPKHIGIAYELFQVRELKGEEKVADVKSKFD